MKHPVVINLLCKLFNQCLKWGMIPSVWKKALIHPIPKTSKREIDPLKFRGISLQSCVYKIFSNLLNVRLTKYLEANDLLEDEQNGFRKS